MFLRQVHLLIFHLKYIQRYRVLIYLQRTASSSNLDMLQNLSRLYEIYYLDIYKAVLYRNTQGYMFLLQNMLYMLHRNRFQVIQIYPMLLQNFQFLRYSSYIFHQNGSIYFLDCLYNNLHYQDLCESKSIRYSFLFL